MSEFIGCYISNGNGLQKLRLDTSKITSNFYKTMPRKPKNRSCKCFKPELNTPKRVQPLGNILTSKSICQLKISRRVVLNNNQGNYAYQ